MSKSLQSIVIVLVVLFTANIALAEGRIYQKVTRKKVEIVEQKEEKAESSDNSYQTVYDSEVDDSSYSNDNMVPASPPQDDYEYVETTDTEDMLVTDKNESGNFYDKQWGFKIGATAPNFGFAGFVTFLPIKMDATSALYTDVALTYGTHSNYNVFSLAINEIAKYNLLEKTSYYIGGGINLPLSVDSGITTQANIGLNFVAGVEMDVEIFNNPNEELFIEAGYNTFNPKGQSSIGVFNILGGYKATF